MKKKIIKNMTIDDLAIITQNGFTYLEEKMDKGFADVDRRFEQVDRRFDSMDLRFDKLEFRVGAYDRRLDNLEDKMRIVNNKLGLA